VSPDEFLGPEMIYHDKALHWVLIQCHKACHSMYIMNHQIDVDTYIVAIVTVSVHHQSGNHSYALFYQGLLVCILLLIFS
jgi:hypothetical protein